MDDQIIITPLLNQARRLQLDTQKLNSFQPAIRINYRLIKAIESVKGPELERPVCVALLGGTGAGKSSLFNAIVRAINASPTSVTRAFTKEPFIASTQDDFAMLTDLRSLDAKHVPFDRPGIVLIDTPDVDSVINTNRDVAQKVVQVSDIIVYVTTADKVSNFEIDQEIRAWSSQKRWFFVMNKIDGLSKATVDEHRCQFEKRLQDIGFDPDQTCLFLLSAVDPQIGNFRDLEEAIYSTRTIDKVKMLRIDGTLGLLENAVASDVLDQIKEKGKRLADQEGIFTSRVQDAYLTAFERSEIEQIIRGIVREKTWQALSGRVGWIMGVVVWLKCRFDTSMLTWQAGRLFRAGPTPLSLLFLGITAASTFWRGILPLRKISAAIGPESRSRLKEIRMECRNALQDEGFNEDEATGLEAEGNTGESNSAWMDAVQKIPFVGDAAANALQVASKTRLYDGELLAPLQTAIDEAALVGARKSVGWIHKFFANLLPTIVLGDVAWRFLNAWLTGRYLPWQFYGAAGAIFFFSLVPGYLLLAAAVNSRAQPPSAKEIVRSITNPAGTDALRAFGTLLSQIVKEAETLKESVARWRSALDQELPTKRFGARLMKKT